MAAATTTKAPARAAENASSPRKGQTKGISNLDVEDASKVCWLEVERD
jgi:hypothetical protein